jgi:tetratricopeptide (TPR) repeat protein
LIKNNSSYKNVALGITGVMILVYSFLTFKQNKIWENGSTLWSHVLKYYPDSDMALNNRARYQRENLKDYKSALDGFNKAIAIKPTPETHNSRGKTYFDMGSGAEFTQKAIADYNAALSMPASKLAKLKNDALAEIYANRGAAYGRLSEELKDKSYLLKALADVTKSIEIINSQLGNPKEAIRFIDIYNGMKPMEADMYYSRCLENRALGDANAALNDVNKAIEYGPESISRAKNANARATQTQYMGYYFLERARIYVSLGNIPAAKQDLRAMKNYGMKTPPDMAQYDN